ncbi:MAG: putative TPR domain protein, component of TonB system [Nitrospira sp.]|nr:MAG: putative TPR domain protein, component of TonB system [Nitrospira sp.]
MTTIKITSTVALVVSLTLLACGGPQERKAQYRARAQEYIQAGNFPKARVALRNVLKIDPKDSEAYFLVAQVEEKEKNWRNAVANYQRVVELVPDHKAALITLAKYYLEARLSNEVTHTTDRVLAKHPQDPQAMALQIAVVAQQAKLGPAIVQAENLSRHHPTEPDVAILLATLYRQQQRFREATIVLRRALQAHPHHLDLLNNLKEALAQGHDIKGTEQIMRQMIEEEPTLFDHRLKLAQFHDQQNAVSQAESVLREATTLFPENEQPWLALADFSSMRKGMSAAETDLRAASKRLPYSTKIAFALGALYERHQDAASARRVYEALVKEYDQKPAGLEAKVKIAQLDFLNGRHQEAQKRLAEVLQANPRSAEGLILQGKIALARRDGKDAVQAFRTVLRDQPELAHVQFLLGQAHVITGEALLGRESFERAVALYPALVDSKLAIAMLDSQSGQPQRARAQLREVVRTHSDNLQAMEMLFALDLAADDWKQAETTLAHLRSAVGEGPVTSMAQGKLHEARRDFAAAEASFEQASALIPNAPEPLLALIRLEVSQKKTDRAQRRLETLITMRPEHPYGHGLLGEVLSLMGRHEQAVIQFREATRVNPTWITPWLSWANLSMIRGQHNEAVRILKEAVAANKASEELHMQLASVYSTQGKFDAAIDAYGTVLRINPRNVFSANNLASLLTDYKGDAASLERAFTLSREFEKDAPHPLFLDTLGWLRLKMGHPDHALRLLKQAIAKAPDLPAVNYHLGSALHQSGNKEEARRYLSKALKSTETFQGRREAEELLARTSG